jgi:TonB-dependent receptor
MSRLSRTGALLAAVSLLALSTAARAADAPADSSGAKTVEQVIVTAPRAASTARLEQQTAPNLINVQSAEAIAKFPDVNAAEALGRIPGVSLSIDTGEGRFVTIRGIDSNLDGATFGGVVLLNSFPGGTYFSGTGRAVEFDTIPIGAVDRIEVTKTGLPDHEAEGLGGSIELSPRSARGVDKFFGEVDLAGGYENLRKSWAPVRDEVVFGGRFGGETKPFSFVVSQFQHNDRRSIDDVEEAYADQEPAQPDKVYDTLELRRYNYFRRRFGYSGELDFDPSSDAHYYFRASLAGYTENVNRQRQLLSNLEFDYQGNLLTPNSTPCAAGTPNGTCGYVDPSNPNGFLAPWAQAAETLRDQQETHKNYLFSAGGDHQFGRGALDFWLAYTKATYDKPYDRNWTFNGPGSSGTVGDELSIAYDNTTDPNFPSFKVLSGQNLADPSNYLLGGFGNSTEKDDDHEWSGAVNYTTPVTLFSSDDTIKFGIKARLRDKTRTTVTYSYDAVPGLSLANFEGGGPYIYYDDHYDIGFRPNGAELEDYLVAHPGQFPFHINSKRDAGNYYHDTENVYAGYGQVQTKLDGVGVLAGVRLEDTDSTYRGLVVTNGVCCTPATTHKSYLNVFPTAQARYDFRPDLVLRATYSTGIGRPGFTQTIASASVDTGAGTVTTGNPNLRPTYGNNFDLALEWYLSNSGILSVGAFDKQFSDYIVGRTVNGHYPGIVGIAKLTTYENVPSAYARGFEAAYVQKFTWLPEAFHNLGVDTNVTYVDSRVALRDGENTLLPGTSPWTANAAVFYEADGLNLRIAAEYVGANLFSIGGPAPAPGAPTTDTWEDKRLQVDFTSSYQVDRHVQVYFNVKDLNNEPLRFYEGKGRPDRPLQREFYDQTFEAGVKARF